MAVPAHDQRDFDFAAALGLPLRRGDAGRGWLAKRVPRESDEPRSRYREAPVVFGEAFEGEGVAVNSSSAEVSLDGLATPEAKDRMILALEAKGLGRRHVQYKLRDWLFSRQRYWGEPFPILHGPDGEIRPVDEADLPVELPDLPDFRPTASDDPDASPRPPLGRAPESWRSVMIDGVRYERELNTMPQWAGTSWYYLRFLDPDNGERFVDREIERYWMRLEDSAAVTPPSGHSRSAVGPAPGDLDGEAIGRPDAFGVPRL